VQKSLISKYAGLILAAIVALFLLYPGSAICQDADAPTTGVLRLEFQNAITWVAVQPKQVLVNGRDETASTDGQGNFSLPTPSGAYEINVTHPDYEPATISVRVEGDDTLVNTVALDPKPSANPEDEPVTATVGVIDAFILDEDTGQPIAGATGSIADPAASAQSDKTGRLSLEIPVEGKVRDTTPMRRVSLLVKKAGYRAVMRRNVEVLAGNRKIYQIRLTALSQEEAADSNLAPQEIDEARPQRQARLNGWAFDVGTADPVAGK
jgi:hypothetical protein